MANQFLVYAKPRIRAIERELDNLLVSWQKGIKRNITKISCMTELFVGANKGGGRLRGVLIILGYETAGGKKFREIGRVATAIELFQTGILAQDDFMDNSELRRGIPALYRAIASWHKSHKMRGDPLHFGASQAVNLGTVSFFLASDVIAQSNFPDDRKVKALSAFNRLITSTALGQILDITVPALKSGQSEEDVFLIDHYKTAQYTGVGPLVIGAHLAGAREEMIKALTRFGENLGIAFQIQDDIKGIFGKSEQTGKSAKEDIIEGKITLLYLYAMRHSDRSQKATLSKLYGNAKISEREAESVRAIFRDTGALTYAQRKALGYATKARLQIKRITKNTQSQSLYNGLADFIIGKEK